ncbi:MAG: thiamine phosphate synthase [Rickettsiales bacterium]|nr:thiamine phosphate synthase [Rickettsiales bacterium]
MRQIYLISKPQINDLDHFAKNLESAFATNEISIFQLRLKNVKDSVWIESAKIAKQICKDYNVKFIINDRSDLINEINPDGIHLGQSDGDIISIRKQYGDKFIIGRSCYDSKEFAQIAEKDQASYVAFGTFFLSKSKEQIYKPQKEIINWAKSNLKVKICAIGGLYSHNINYFDGFMPDYFCFISAIWDEDNIQDAVNKIADQIKLLKK